MKKVLVILTLAVLFVGCADRTAVTIDTAQHIYGFWGGVWHGAIMLPDFIMSLFYDDVAVYATNNNGVWYDFGFVGGLGLCIKGIRLVLNIIANILNQR